MAVYKLFPSQDATLYSNKPTQNSGVDPILEVGRQIDTDGIGISRYLIKFDQGEISNIINNKVNNMPFTSTLKNYIAYTQGVTSEVNLEVSPIFGNWNNGSGEHNLIPEVSDGVSWEFRHSLDNTPWSSTSLPTNVISTSPQGIAGGGAWYGDKTITKTFGLRSPKDLNIDVTDIVSSWSSASISNEGFIIKWEDSIENVIGPNPQPLLKYYSVDTHTIYPPTLEIKWDDSIYEPGNLDIISNEDIFLSLDNNKGTFHKESINRFRINVRPEFPVRTFQTSSNYTQNHALPQTSYYAIKDLDTNEFVIDYDESATKISCDSNSNYFDLNMNGLEPERYYQILIKVNIGNRVIVKDEGYYFKVING